MGGAAISEPGHHHVARNRPMGTTTMDRQRIRGRIRPRPAWGGGGVEESPEATAPTTQHMNSWNRLRRNRNCTKRRFWSVPPPVSSRTSGAGPAPGPGTLPGRTENSHGTRSGANLEVGGRRRGGIRRRVVPGGSPAVELKNQKRPPAAPMARADVKACYGNVGQHPNVVPNDDRRIRRKGRDALSSPLRYLYLSASAMMGMILVVGLLLGLTSPALAQTPSSQPSVSSRPSSAPSLSAQPSVSSQPSSAPSLSAQPSAGPTLSAAPSSVPTVSAEPSAAPTALDSDNDGVPDSSDQCRYEGGHVNTWGCPIDTDDDGIADCISNLHHTLSGCDFDPQSATFNSTCCNIEWDRCFSDTPPGAGSSSTLRAYVQNTTYINSNGTTIEPGCPSDEDDDGVVDGMDQCPNTTVVEKDLAAEADGKMTLYTTGTNAGCAILNASAWDSVFLDVVTNSSSILSDPGLEAVFAVDATMISAQESRVGAGFGASSVARFSVLDPSCTRKYDDITQSGDELFTITMYLNDLSQSFFTGQIPEGTVPLSAYIDFNPDLITQSPLWELEYPFSIGTVDCCIRLELLSKDGDVQATHEVVSLTRYNMNQGFAVIDSEMADVVREQASEAISWLDVHYPLKACQCDFFDYCIDNDPTSDSFNGGSLGQGDELKICIFFDDTNGLPEPYVKIADIKTFTCNKEGTSLIHMPISDNRYANGDGLTSVKINNGDVTDAKGRLIKVGTILPPAFFDREPGTAACEGIVQYDFLQNDNIFSRRRQRVLIEASPPAPSSRLPGGSAKSVFNVEIGLAAAWQGPETGAGTSTIRFGRGFLYGIMIMFASVAMLLVARPGSYRACWHRLPCSKYEIKIEKDGAVLTKTTGFSTAVEDSEPPVAHIFVHEEYDEQDETYTQMSCSQFGHNSLSAIETGSSTMLPPMEPDRRAKKRRNNSLDFFKSKLQSDDDSPSPRSSSKRPSLDFFKNKAQNNDVVEARAHAESSSRSVRFMID